MEEECAINWETALARQVPSSYRPTYRPTNTFDGNNLVLIKRSLVFCVVIVGKKAPVHGGLTIEVCRQSTHSLSLSCRERRYMNIIQQTFNIKQWAHSVVKRDNTLTLCTGRLNNECAVSQWVALSNNTWMATLPRADALLLRISRQGWKHNSS